MNRIFITLLLSTVFSLSALDQPSNVLKLKCGSNIRMTPVKGFVDKDGKKSLKLPFRYANPADKTPDRIWFELDTPMTATAMDGQLSCEIRRDIPGHWHLNFNITEKDGTRFFSPLFYYIPGKYTKKSFALSEFRCKDKNRRVRPSQIKRVGICGGTSQDTLYVRNFRFSPAAMKIVHGSNLKITKSEVRETDGTLAESYTFRYINPLDKTPDKIWFEMERPAVIDPQQNPVGLTCQIRRNIPGDWYMHFLVRDKKGRVFRSPLFQYLPGKYKNFTYQFKDFRASDKKLRLDPKEIVTIGFGGGSKADTIFIKQFFFLNKTGNLQAFLTAHPDGAEKDHLIEPGKEILWNLSGTIPGGVKQLCGEMRDCDGKLIVRKILQVNPGPFHQKWKFAERLPAGYYSFQVYAGGYDNVFSKKSILKTTGSQEIPGLFSMAVLPFSREANKKAALRDGENGFFGVQSPRDHELAERLGASWRIEMPLWQYTESKKPKRNPGQSAEWAAKKIAKGPARKDDLAFCSFAPHTPSPKWAKKLDFKRYAAGEDYPAFSDFLRDAVRVHAKKFPHMSKRLYELIWEMNLQFPPNGKTTMEDIVGFHRQVVPLVKSADPKAVICGPKATFDVAWVERAFKAGLGKYLDMISMHMYTTPVPEEGGLPEKIAQLRAIAKRYTGRNMEICNTEGGYQSRFNGTDCLALQAERDIRYMLIMKGEGVRTVLLFYVHDFAFGEYNTWGLFFSPERYGGFSPAYLMPKPVVPAYAACANLLAGKRPVFSFRRSGSPIWGYAFGDKKEIVLTLWNPNGNMKYPVPVGNVKTVTCYDFFGNPSRLPVRNGIVEITVSKRPVYLCGVEPSLYAGASGTEKEVRAGDLLPFNGKTFTYAPAGIRKAGKNLCIPENIQPGLYPVLHDGRKFWLHVLPSLELTGTEFTIENGKLLFLAKVRNNSNRKLIGTLCCSGITDTPVKKQIPFTPHETRKTDFVLFTVSGNFNPIEPIRFTFGMSDGKQSLDRSICHYFLAAQPKGQKDSVSKASVNHVEISGPSADGKTDKARIVLSYDRNALYIYLRVEDKQHSQPYKAGDLWRSDAVQIGIDTDPLSDTPYDEATARLSKKVTQLEFGLSNDKQVKAARHLTYKEQVLPTGNVTSAFPKTKITRKDGVTEYELVLPWKEIGLDSKEIVPGKKIGFSLLINDGDGSKKRCTYGLFGGIYDNSGWRRFGIFTLL